MKLGTLNSRGLALVVATTLLTAGDRLNAAGDPSLSNMKDEGQLIGVLESGAPLPMKAIACKRLAIYGTAEAVPALASLLPNEDLASWARIALEAIPDPAVDEALRAALDDLRGRLLVGAINSIGVRRDARAVDALVERLDNADTDVACAAAAALGRIGGEAAARALSRRMAAGPPEVRSACAAGCVRCAEGFLAEGDRATAIRLYDLVRQTDLPKQRIVEATRGAILARQSDGLALLLEQLRSPDRDLFLIGLRTARELPGPEVTEALAVEVDHSHPDRAGLILLAVADRSDPAALRAVIDAAINGPDTLRLVAVEILGRLGRPEGLPALLEAAAADDRQLAQKAQAALVRLEGAGLEADLLARLSRSTGPTRLALLELAGQRRMDAALPLISRWAIDPDPELRRAAIRTVGILGAETQAVGLVRLLARPSHRANRDDLESALLAITGRCGRSCTDALLPLMASDDTDLREIGLRALASVGGPDALAAVIPALKDSNQAVQDEAVAVLATWPNNWPEDDGVAGPLLTLARSGQAPSHRVQAVRGYLRYLQEDPNLEAEQRLAGVREVLPAIQRAEEKRLVIATVGATPTPQALQLLLTFAADPELSEESYLAIINVCTNKELRSAPSELRRQALQTVVDGTANDATKQKAQALLRSL